MGDGSFIELPPSLGFFELPKKGRVLFCGAPESGKTGLVFTLCEELCACGIPVMYYDLDRSMHGAVLKVDPDLFKVYTDPNYLELARGLKITNDIPQMVVVVSGARNLVWDDQFMTTPESLSKLLVGCRTSDTLVVIVERDEYVDYDVRYKLVPIKNYRNEGQIEYRKVNVYKKTDEGLSTYSFTTLLGGRLSLGAEYLKKILNEDPTKSPLSSFELPSGQKVRGGMNLIRAIDKGKEVTWRSL